MRAEVGSVKVVCFRVYEKMCYAKVVSEFTNLGVRKSARGGFFELQNMSAVPGQIDAGSTVTTCDWFNSSNDVYIDHIWVYNDKGEGCRQQQRGLRVKISSLINAPCCVSHHSANVSSDLMMQPDSGAKSRRKVTRSSK